MMLVIGCFLVDEFFLVMMFRIIMKIFMMIFRCRAPVIVLEGRIIIYNSAGRVNLTSNLPAM